MMWIILDFGWSRLQPMQCLCLDSRRGKAVTDIFSTCAHKLQHLLCKYLLNLHRGLKSVRDVSQFRTSKDKSVPIFSNMWPQNDLWLKRDVWYPGWCSSVDWAPACRPKGCQFDSQSGHMPGLQARSPVGGTQEATTHWFFSPSLSPSLPLSLKISK